MELAQSSRLRTASAATPPFDGLPGGNGAWRAEQQQRLTDLVPPERKFSPGAHEDPSSRHRNHFSLSCLLPVFYFFFIYYPGEETSHAGCRRYSDMSSLGDEASFHRGTADAALRLLRDVNMDMQFIITNKKPI